MTSLKACLDNAGIHTASTSGTKCNITATYNKEYDAFLKNNQDFFARACSNKPEHSERQILLGLLTKLQIEATSSVQTNQSSSHAMAKVFENTVGKEHAGKFEHTQTTELIFITHLWLYIQGRLGMDFSLANDHALAASQLTTSHLTASKTNLSAEDNSDTLDGTRTQLLSSYYSGLEHYQNEHPPRGLLSRIKSYFV